MRSSTLVVLVISTAACSSSPAPEVKKAAPAVTVQHPRTEAELTTVTLSPEAVTRLGVQSVAVAVERIALTRTVGGDVIVPEGRAITVSAPIAGTLTATDAASAGTRVGRGDVVFRLLPLMASERDQHIEADRAVAAAEAETQAARQRLQRLEQLLKDGAASVRSVEEARAQLDVTTAALAAARERVKVVSRNPIGSQGDIAIAAPFAGVLQTISAAQGQTVAASQPLFEIVQVDTLWVRVPIYAGDASDIDRTRPVAVTTLDGKSPPRPARRITAPLKADPGAASVDLFFEVTGGGEPLRPGERVTVQLPLTSADTGLVIPVSAIVYDIHGATWVYEDLGKNAYARRRVDIARQLTDRAVVSRGLAAGVRVVTVGAAELLGTEFGAGK